MPRTLLRLADTTEYAVIEMGMSALGEIERLSRCAKPNAGIIPCIGVSHMETLGSRENILKAKLEICAGLPQGAPLALNGDDEYLRGAALPGHVRPVWYALDDASADVRAETIEQLPGGSKKWMMVTRRGTAGFFLNLLYGGLVLFLVITAYNVINTVIVTLYAGSETAPLLTVEPIVFGLTATGADTLCVTIRNTLRKMVEDAKRKA